MESTDNRLERFAERVSREKLHIYTQILRDSFTKEGIDPSLFDNLAQTANLELQIRESENSIASRALRSEENRGIDTVGRIMIEYCFIRTTNGKMIWPEYSDEDTMARWQFSENVLPRPLMRYFLISLRGTIEEIDGFSTPPFLYEESPEQMDLIRQTLSEFIDEYKGPFGSGESSVDWKELYEDTRSQQMGLNLIRSMRVRIKTTGLEDFLRRLNDYRTQDPHKEEANLMQRSFNMEDIAQIEQALESAEARLTNSV